MEMYGDFHEFDHLYDALIRTSDGSEFPVHRVLLALRSKYFHNLFCTEASKETSILLPSIEGPAMKDIIEYLYSGHLNLIENNISDVLAAAFFLGIEELFQNCRISASRKLNTSNCIPLFLTAMKIEDWDFLKACIRFIAVHFERVLRDPRSRFHDLPKEPLEQFLVLDNLNVSNEFKVWFAIDLWISKDPECRKAHVIDLIMYIRFSEGSDDLVTEILNHPVVIENPYFHYIKNLVTHHSLPFKYRLPEQFSFITKTFISFTDFTEGIKVYITYDEDIDFWRNIGWKSFTPDVILHGCGPLIVMFDTGLNIIYTFNIISKRWAPLNPPTASRREYNVVKLGRFVYALGGIVPGENYVVSTSVERYDFDSGEWENTKPQHALCQGAAAVIDNRICVIGTFSGFFDEVIMAQSYNPNADSWSSFTPPNTYRRLFAFVVYRNHLLVIGGHSSAGFLKSVEIYDAKRNVWDAFEELPFSYFLPKAVVVKGVLYVYENHPEDVQEIHCPPVRWDELGRRWQVVEASSPFCDLHLYQFCVIDESEVIMQMRHENRDPVTEWIGSPFFKYV